MTKGIVPPVRFAKCRELQGNRGGSGDGGNRTRATFPPSPTPTKADLVDLIGIYRVIVRARTGWRFTSTEWAA